MALIEVSTHIQGSAEASVVPIRKISVSAELKGHASAGPRPPQPRPKPQDFSRT